MDFHSDLIKITEFQPLEDYLVRKKASELYKTSQSNKITVSVNPSNLVELTRVGERFAPDSCVENLSIKYILSNTLIPNTQIPTHFESLRQNSFSTSIEENKVSVTPLIPNMIVRQRPGISYQPIRETSYFSVREDQSVQDEEKASVKSASTPGLQKEVFRIPSTVSKKEKNATGKGAVRVIKAEKESAKGKEVKKDETVKRAEKGMKRKKKVKTILKKKSEDVEGSSNSEKKTVTWEEEEEDQANVAKEHEAKRKMHLDKFKYQVPSYLKEKEAETLNRLEKIVEDEKELLKQRGIETPESSQGSKYKKTYEELEKEIQNIREMLSEDGAKPEQVDEDYEEAEISEYDEEEGSESQENVDVDYCYSSDDCKEEKAWMKPRFK